MWCQDGLDVRHDAQSDSADFAVGDAAHRSGRRGNIANDGLGAIEEFRSRAGESNSTSRARQQWRAHFASKPTDQLTQRGLRHVECLGSPTKGEFGHHCHERLELAELHPV
jgi:hypothetical protein